MKFRAKLENFQRLSRQENSNSQEGVKFYWPNEAICSFLTRCSTLNANSERPQRKALQIRSLQNKSN